MGKQLVLSRLLLRVVIYSVLLNICLTLNWISPRGSILQNILTAFFIWVIPQMGAFFFLRGRDFGLGKRWLVQGVIHAILLTVFLSQEWVVPGGNFSTNTLAGLAIYMSSYIVAVLLQ